MDEFEQLKKAIADSEADVLKGLGGNKAAQTRARKAMQEVKTLAQAVREKLLAARGEGESDSNPQGS